MVFPIRQKGVPPLLLPTSMLQLPRCLVRICNLFHKDNQLRISKFQKMQLQQEKQFSKTNLLRKCGLLAHTSAAFLKNCCTEKLFVCLRLVFDSLTSPDTTRPDRVAPALSGLFYDFIFIQLAVCTNWLRYNFA